MDPFPHPIAHVHHSLDPMYHPINPINLPMHPIPQCVDTVHHNLDPVPHPMDPVNPNSIGGGIMVPPYLQMHV